jgi:hypothetical protein
VAGASWLTRGSQSEATTPIGTHHGAPKPLDRLLDAPMLG